MLCIKYTYYNAIFPIYFRVFTNVQHLNFVRNEAFNMGDVISVIRDRITLSGFIGLFFSLLFYFCYILRERILMRMNISNIVIISRQ